MAYSAGTLEMSIFDTSSGQIANIDKMVKSLSSLSRVITKIEKLDFSKTEKGFQQLATAITPFIDKIKEAETSLNSLYGILQKTGGQKTHRFSGGFGFGGLGSAVTITSTMFLARRLGRFVGEIAQSGADYAETLNLWEVSMGKNIDQATKFVDKLNEAYGVSKETLMNSQAIFKNMLGTLGEIEDKQAYILSEGITQMALDYASLYNVTFEQAMTKFQAALAGQVRPIRSTSGFDITEKTIYSLYQSLDGEKTQRQLTITEKRLLSILAIFEQMEASGATGDLGKTINSFANQSRVMADSWKQVKAYAGAILTTLLTEARVMVIINAALIATERTLEDIGNLIGAFEGFGAEPFGDIGEGAEDAETNVDELNKSLNETMGLLDIDKFRVLSTTDSDAEENLGIDEKITEGFKKYKSIIEQVRNEAAKLADKFYDVREAIVAAGVAFGLVFVVKNIDKIKNMTTAVKKLAGVDKLSGFGLLEAALAGSTIFFITDAIDKFREGDEAAGLFSLSLGVLSGYILLTRTEFGKLLVLKVVKWFTDFSGVVKLAFQNVKWLNGALAAMGLVVLAQGVSKFIDAWDDMSGVQRAIGIVAALASAIAAAVVGIKIFGMNWAGALGAAALMAGTALAVTSSIKIPKYANGASDLDGGTMFIAGEMGKTEAVYTGGNGKTNVANVQQMEQAFYNALSRYGAEGGGTIVIQTNLDGEKIYENTTRVAGKRGQKWATVR